ncbi:hypothetical protein COV15_00295 [Candidatus Woesearchaeota archaeon CG10_big_fil_rev_8_21_14_0_10_34_12]|nr:MAG: hypothetical protein COV15_00295 [Candidatus Woesearchaeota archaeon CG10_big_fil_rev_8_21_14_0_10_34_12]
MAREKISELETLKLDWRGIKDSAENLWEKGLYLCSIAEYASIIQAVVDFVAGYNTKERNYKNPFHLILL